jgi:transposase
MKEQSLKRHSSDDPTLVTVDEESLKFIMEAASVGVDFGISHLAVLSDGTMIDGPRPLKQNLMKLRRLSRSQV